MVLVDIYLQEKTQIGYESSQSVPWWSEKANDFSSKAKI
jgi:hypothetical protein